MPTQLTVLQMSSLGEAFSVWPSGPRRNIELDCYGRERGEERGREMEEI